MTPADLRERRKRLGLSQAELAELLGVDRTSVIRWEAGKPMPPFLALAIERLEMGEPIGNTGDPR